MGSLGFAKTTFIHFFDSNGCIYDKCCIAFPPVQICVTLYVTPRDKELYGISTAIIKRFLMPTVGF